jgi:anion-transporting  ArsA/GET3 family ATPase
VSLALKNKAVESFFPATPAAAPMLLLYHLWRWVEDYGPRGNKRFDLFVCDMPTSGFVQGMYNIPDTLQQVFRSGPMFQYAAGMRLLLANRRQTGLVLVSLPEALPVVETLELAAAIQAKHGVTPAAVIVNGVFPPLLHASDLHHLHDRLQAHDVEAESAAAALEAAVGAEVLTDRADLAAWVWAAALLAERRERAVDALQRLEAAAPGTLLALPFLFKRQLPLAAVDQLAGLWTTHVPAPAQADPAGAAPKAHKVGQPQRAGDGQAGSGTAALLALIDRSKLLVLSGSGGVGKTTSAAALALTAALRGRRVLVLTIDPAMRLLQAMGLDGQGLAPNQPHEVLPRMAGALTPDQTANMGSLHAMMLDATTGAVAMVDRLLPDPSVRDEVLNNRVYKAFLPTLQASPDYIALELIQSLSTDPRFDLLVLDTPPMHNALDFLRAGHTLASFVNERVLRWFAKVPTGGKKGLSWLTASTSVAMTVLGKLFGSDALPDIAAFFAHFQDVLPRLRDRALATDAMLRQPTTQFLVVAAPGETSKREASHLAGVLRAHDIAVAGLIVNRVLQLPGGWEGGGATGWLGKLASLELPTELGHRLHQLAEGLGHLHDADADHVQALRSVSGRGGLLSTVPLQSGELHTLAELGALGQRIVDGCERT